MYTIHTYTHRFVVVIQLCDRCCIHECVSELIPVRTFHSAALTALFAISRSISLNYKWNEKYTNKQTERKEALRGSVWAKKKYPTHALTFTLTRTHTLTYLCTHRHRHTHTQSTSFSKPNRLAARECRFVVCFFKVPGFSSSVTFFRRWVITNKKTIWFYLLLYRAP